MSDFGAPDSRAASNPTVLLVDDDATLRGRLADAFRDRGLEVLTAGNLEDAVELATAQSPELAVVDLRMPGRGGMELVQALKAIDPTTRIVVLTGYGSIATAIEAVRLGATHYLPKPADADEILGAFNRDRPGSVPVSDPQPPTPSLARAEWEHIQRVLADCHGNISEASRRLGIHRRSLQRKLQKHPPRG
jgi:two-component system, response regulator RegA